MFSVQVTKNSIPAMSEIAINTVRELEKYILECPQTEIPTQHIFHAGLYARTIKIPAGVVLTGALIKIATFLVISGHCIIYVGEESFERKGYYPFAASANRKQAFVAIEDTYLTMVFPTDTKTVDEAERQFTDEFNCLSSRYDDAVNEIIVTGE